MGDQWAFWIISLAAAGAGAWLGSYLREKGKNYATKEDVQVLTRLTEEIRADISGKMWLDQKRWDLKRDFYWELLAVINSLSSALRDMRGFFKRYKLAPEKIVTLQSEFGEFGQRAQAQEDALVRILGIGRILLAEDVVALLDSYQADLKQLEREAFSEMNRLQVDAKSLAAMNDTDRDAYFLRFVEEFPEALTRIVDAFQKKHASVLPAIIQAARKDLLSLRKVGAD